MLSYNFLLLHPENPVFYEGLFLTTLLDKLESMLDHSLDENLVLEIRSLYILSIKKGAIGDDILAISNKQVKSV